MEAGEGVGVAPGEVSARHGARGWCGAGRGEQSGPPGPYSLLRLPVLTLFAPPPNPRPPPYLHSHELVSTLYTQWPPAQTTVHSELRRAPMSRRRLPRPQTSVASALSAGPLDTCTGPDQIPGIRSTAPDDICAHAQTPSLDAHVDPDCISPQPPSPSPKVHDLARIRPSEPPLRTRPGPAQVPAQPQLCLAPHPSAALGSEHCPPTAARPVVTER